jgi:hypothetical protein
MSYMVFEYLYRDASNYKAFGEVWLTGALSDDDKSIILNCFESREFFVAEQIGVPPLYRQVFEFSGGRTEDDHAWHTFEGFRSEDDLADDAEVWGSAAKLVQACKAATRNWKPALSPNFVEW